ncbi:MAG: hypothetical protein GQ564_11485 [Bacteroidales bacterium]|nr:hypothetical protein [Bacteroidales bacterium]
MFTSKEQSFLSYISIISKGVPQSKECIEARFLPKGKKSIYKVHNNEYSNYFAFQPEDNKLYESIYLDSEEACLLINGFFYEKPQYPKSINSKNELKKYLNSLNGNFNGYFIDKINNLLYLFCDYFGFDKQFYLINNNIVYISSFIWPLIKFDKEGTVNKSAITEHLVFGYPLLDKTIFTNIKVVKPEQLIQINLKTNHITYDNWYCKSNSIIKDPQKTFYHLTEKHFTFLKNRINPEKWGNTLTGGNDTRLILNSFLKSNISPICITAKDRKFEIDRAKLISKHFNLDWQLIDNNPNIVNNYSFWLSNGYTNGESMTSLALNSTGIIDSLHYGYSGDLISGGVEIDSNQIKRKGFPYILKSKLDYNLLNLDTILNFTHFHADDILNEFSKSYNSTIEDLSYSDYLLQERKERNFRRIGSFSEGAKLGPIPIYFFHDKTIIDFYNNLDYKYLKNQNLHIKLSFYKNWYLGIVPSANNLPVPSFTMNLFNKYIPHTYIKKVKKLQAKKLKKISFSDKSSYYNIYDEDYTQLDLDFELLYNSLKKELITNRDAHLLKRRLKEIKETINFKYSD